MSAVLDAPCVPTRSLQQRMEALARANVVRMARAQVKRDLKARRLKVVDLLLDPPEEIEGMRIYDLLVSVPGLGPYKVRSMLTREQLSPSKSIGGMTERQRNVLIERVDPFAIR